MSCRAYAVAPRNVMREWAFFHAFFIRSIEQLLSDGAGVARPDSGLRGIYQVYSRNVSPVACAASSWRLLTMARALPRRVMAWQEASRGALCRFRNRAARRQKSIK